VVFNTSLTGYQEIFTDPSYAGQIVVLTNPHIGNYGTTPSDAESARPYIEGLVTREFSPMSSNWRSTEVADEYLERSGVPVIAEIDTRAVVRHLRANGVMRGVIATARRYGCAGGEGAGDQEDGWDGSGERREHEGAYEWDAERAEEPDGRQAAAGRGCADRRRGRCMWWRMTSGSSRISCGC
jgi:carbamoyl-phosphate synthase small subunit